MSAIFHPHNVYPLSQYSRSCLACEISYFAEKSLNCEHIHRISRLQYANAAISFTKFCDDRILRIDFRHKNVTKAQISPKE